MLLLGGAQGGSLSGCRPGWRPADSYFGGTVVTGFAGGAGGEGAADGAVLAGEDESPGSVIDTVPSLK